MIHIQEGIPALTAETEISEIKSKSDLSPAGNYAVPSYQILSMKILIK
mgnify:FL=1